MITTKKAKKLLTKKDQQHLTKSNINSLEKLQNQITWMKETQPEDPWKICPECFRIAHKLGIVEK